MKIILEEVQRILEICKKLSRWVEGCENSIEIGKAISESAKSPDHHKRPGGQLKSYNLQRGWRK